MKVLKHNWSDSSLAKLIVPSPLGSLLALASERGVRAILFSDADPERRDHDGNVVTGETHAMRTQTATATMTLTRLAEQLAEYFAGSRTQFDVPLDPVGTEFQQQAWLALREIPFGQTRSYAEQARAIGRPSAVRAIGAANGRNPLTIVVPCHRVIGADGTLTGFAGGLHRKRALLEHEGVLRATGELPFAP